MLPKLIVFVVCERVITDQTDNTASLIGLLQDIRAEIPASALSELPPKTRPMAPIRWTSFAMWERTDAADTEYQQRVVLLDPDGERTGIEAKGAFRFGDKRTIRVSSVVPGFPMHKAGRFLLRLWISESDLPENSEPIAEYAVNVQIEQPKT